MNRQAELRQHPAHHESSRPAPADSRRVSDHLANERTFLAWMRTGLATITFGFVVERFGLVVHELDPTTRSLFVLSFQMSSLIGVALTALGVIMFVFALRTFLRNRRAIDARQFRASAGVAVMLTVLASSIGVLLAIYLLLSA